FEESSAKLKHLLLDQEFSDIFTIDMALMRWAMDVLAIQTPVVCSSSLHARGNQTELLVNICKQLDADRYLSGSGGRTYMDLAAFERAGIRVTFQEFTSPMYAQLFPEAGFIPDLSIVDVLFNCGPAARRFLD